MPAVTFDPFDQAQLTGLIQRALTTRKENLPSLGDQIAPYYDVRERKCKFRIVEVEAFGVGQLRARDGDPKLFRTKARVREELIELALPDEMERISEDILDRLDSTDPVIRLSAGVDLVTRGQVLAERARRRVEKMRWEAFLNGFITNPYDDNSDYRITFDMPASNKFTAGSLWSTLSTDLITQVRGWQKQMADTIGEYGLWLHMNSNTYEFVYNNTVVASKLSTWGRSLLTPTSADVASLFRDGSQIIIYDGGYRDEIAGPTYPVGNLTRGDSQLTRWLPDGKVLITPANYTANGEPIADTPNGRVRVANGYNSADWVQGPAAEKILHPVSKNEFLRYARANIPRMLIPEAFMVVTVL